MESVEKNSTQHYQINNLLSFAIAKDYPGSSDIGSGKLAILSGTLRRPCPLYQEKKNH